MLIDFIALQIGWFACVPGGAHHERWLGTVGAVVLVGVRASTATPLLPMP